MRQLCNYAYMVLAEGRDRVGLAELNAILAGPKMKEVVRDRGNAEAMATLGGLGMIPPPRRR